MKRLLAMLVLGLTIATAGAQPPGRQGGYDRKMDRPGRDVRPPDRGHYPRDPGDRRMTQDERREMRRELDQANEEIYKRRRDR